MAKPADENDVQQSSPGPPSGWERAQTYAKHANDVTETIKHVKGVVVVVAGLTPGGFNEYALSLGAGIVASLLVTIPLTIAVALITYTLVADDTSIGRVLLAILALVAGNLAGLSTGTAGIAAAWDASHANIFNFGVQLMLGYGLTYGFVAYFAPLAIGVGAGWIWAQSRH